MRINKYIAAAGVTSRRKADELIVTSSSNVCMYVDELDGKPFGGKDQATLFRLRDALYQEICEATE